MKVSHAQIIECLRKFADELEQCDPRNRPEWYGVGGYQARLFWEYGLEIRAEVKCDGEIGAIEQIKVDDESIAKTHMDL